MKYIYFETTRTMKKLLPLFLFCIFAQQGFSQYTVSQITYAPDSFNQGTSVAVMDDSYSGLIQMPFSFCFYGAVYNSLTFGANGIISFNSSTANNYCQWPIGAAAPSPTNPHNSIMMPWQDIYRDSAGHFYYNTYGNAPFRRFVLSIYRAPMYSCLSSQFTGEAILYETTNIIEIHIQRKDLCPNWNMGAAIEGVHNSTGTVADIVPGRNYPTQWTAFNDAWRFTPSSCPTGLGKEYDQNALNIFPNPASNEVHLSFTNAKSEKFSVEMTDVSGRVIYRDGFSAQNERIINPNVPAGIYFVRLINENAETLATRKLAIE
jgi:hypothetical protein